MSNRFLHDRFTQVLSCAHCDGSGEIEGKAEGFFDSGRNFVLTGFTDANGREIKLTDEQKAIVERRGDERFSEVETENREHNYAVAHEFQNNI